MLKKIILGIVIVVVISVTAFGTIYAYQKEKTRTDGISSNKNLALQYGSDPAEDSNGTAAVDCEDCLKEKERIRNNFRYRQNEDQECTGQNKEEYSIWQYLYRYENQNLKNGQDECIKEDQFNNQNGTSGNRRSGK